MRDMVRISLGFLALWLAPSVALGAWADGTWPFRRAVDVEYPEKSTGEELVCVELYTAGGHQASGQSIRVAGEDGKFVPSQLLMAGPGDKIQVLFAVRRGMRRYYVYFGNPKPPAAPRGTDEVPIRSGLLLEMKKYDGPLVNNFRQVQEAWIRGKDLIGRTMINRLFLGLNPFGQEMSLVARIEGTLVAPFDGQYTFAGAASDKGALLIDGNPVLFIPQAPADTRFSATVEMKRGKHAITCYLLNVGGEVRLSLAWKRPGAQGFEVIPAEAFGTLAKGTVGPLEQKDKPLVADMKIEYAGECFYADHYSHRYRFTGPARSGLKYEWDFGDGQRASGASVDHVFLTEGQYPVTLTLKSGAQGDTKTNRLRVGRQYERLENPLTDLPSGQAKIVGGYDLSKLPAESLAGASLLFVRVRDGGLVERAAVELAGRGAGAPKGLAGSALGSAEEYLLSQGQVDAAARMWEAVPADAPLQPEAAIRHAQLLLWRKAEFAKAAKVLEGQVRKHGADRGLQRVYAQALILNQQVGEGKKILEGLPVDGPVDRQAALAGALARTIEFYINQGDWETGEQSWERWQQQYPADFMEGYSLLLKTKLMEVAKAPEAAAKVAEAFALAVPKSSYAPGLLDRASKLLAKTNPQKSQALREMLKQKYPEDPLSQ